MLNSNKLISVAIPTFNSSLYLKDCLNSLLNVKIIGEIIISDDCSNDFEFEEINNIVEGLNTTKEIKIYRNDQNLGAFINKYENIKKCSNEIVYQIDSDNIASNNLPNVLGTIIKDREEYFLYLPSKIYQFRKYPKIAKLLSIFNNKYKVTFTNKDFIFDKDIIKKAIQEELKVTEDKNLNWVLNSGNFIVNRNKFLEIMKNYVNENVRYPMDAVAISYFWIENGGSIKTLKSLRHFHRKRSDSVSFVENKGSYESLTSFRNKFLELN
ncbi:MAG: hypothetical protein CBD44_00945 [Flavobacteriaceae bacterium TMED184]|mgnify:CR=1 FL=1|nr:MAG: hypothetical protein CBD44_00945 [Flavobacteriaceae bacterium TMED184]|tara:strand:+ start:1936 stop:2739 length:804 start_codon:yes stop_codon:yes gene_type:complete